MYSVIIFLGRKQQISQPKFETHTSRAQVRNFTDSADLLSFSACMTNFEVKLPFFFLWRYSPNLGLGLPV
jgi:hypothetical protein